jgi:hypothetical protein
MRVLAVDPGTKYLGAALFIGGRLEAVFYEKAHNQIAVVEKLYSYTGDVGTCAVEGQQVYPGARRNNPNDLIPLAYQAGAIHAIYNRPGTECLSILPRVWTRSMPKDVRTERILSALDEEERSVLKGFPKSKFIHIIDAVGIGLFVTRGKV